MCVVGFPCLSLKKVLLPNMTYRMETGTLGLKLHCKDDHETIGKEG